MNWIIISHFGLTKRNVASRRIRSLCEALSRLDQKVSLITWNSGFPDNELYKLNVSITVYKIGYRECFFANRIRRFSHEGKHNSFGSSRVTTRRNSFSKGFRKLAKSLLLNPYYATGGSLVSNRSLRISPKDYLRNFEELVESKQRKMLNSTVVLTSSGPAIMHEIGCRIKRRFPEVYWIADYRDQIIGNPTGKATRKMKKANHMALSCSDLITTVSAGLGRDLVRFSGISHSIVESKLFVLYNGLYKEDNETIEESSTVCDNRKIRLVYAGQLYENRRIDLIIRSLNNEGLKDGYELIYCGPSFEQVNQLLGNERIECLVKNKGFVSKQEAEKEQDEADILLLLKSNEPESGGMTGKFFEYLERDKPILVLGDSDLEFNEIARKIGGIYVLPYDEEKIKEFLIDFANKWPFEIERNTEEVDKFNWNNLAKGLIEEVERRLNKS
jgi:glycosyltransferase involved in cell wall biosynthesis